MSGGHWEHCQDHISQELQAVAEDTEVLRRFPHLARSLENLSDRLYWVIKALDWDLSGDTPIADDARFEHEALHSLRWD